MNFCIAILMLKWKKIHNIFGILYFIVSRKVKTQLKCKRKICAVYGEGAVTDRTCQKLRSSVLEISCWTMVHNQVDQLKLIVIKSRPWENSTLYHMGDSQHTQNIQISKVIGEKEKCVFYFTVKTWRLFCPAHYYKCWCVCYLSLCLFPLSPSLSHTYTHNTHINIILQSVL